MELEELGEPEWLEQQDSDLSPAEADAVWHDGPEWVDAYEF